VSVFNLVVARATQLGFNWLAGGEEVVNGLYDALEHNLDAPNKGDQLMHASGGFVGKQVKSSLGRIFRNFRRKISPGEELLRRSDRAVRNAERVDAAWAALQKGEDIEAWWPYRSKADRGLRLCRFPDLVGVKDGITKSDLSVVSDFDYILALNLCLLRVVNQEVFTNLDTMGMFDGGYLTYVTNTKRLSTVLKKTNLTTDWSKTLWYFELDCMSGYRNAPDPTFDYRRDVSALANSGHLTTNESYKDKVLANILPVKQTMVPSFRDWVSSLVWVTAGSSSIGKMRVVVEEGEKKVSFKARKNCVPFIYSVDELIDVVNSTNECINVAVIKNEVGKLRVAVASDIGNYLLQAYMLAQIGDSYKVWTGNTLGETADEERSRLQKMMYLCKGRYCLPFDYANFDHQPSTLEIKKILYRIFGQLQLTDESQTLFRQMMSNLDRQWLTGRDGELNLKLRVQGGLMSGYRITSLIGNAWNSWMTETCQNLAHNIFGFKAVAYYIRGDDSAVFFDEWWHAAVFRDLYARVQAVGNNAKFGILWERCEFLRTVITPGGCYAYPARAMVAVSQRKPWSGERWAPSNIITGTADAIWRTARRGFIDLSHLLTHLLDRYALKSRTPHLVAFTPSQTGGAGLLPFKSTKAVVFHPRIARVEITSSWMQSTVSEAAPDLDRKQVESVVSQLASDIVTADDIPSISKQLRKQAQYVLRRARFDRVPQRHWLVGERGYPPPTIKIDEADRYRIMARAKTWGDVARTQPVVYHWVKKVEKNNCPRWMTREFVSGAAPGICDLDPKFRGLWSSRVLSLVSMIKTKTVTDYLSWYNSIAASVAVQIRASREYGLYGRL
jgi:hypothetical protein